MNITGFLKWFSLLTVLTTIVGPGCAALKDNTRQNEEADAQIESELEAIGNKMDELYTESVRLNKIVREESLNAEREKASGRILDETRDRYLAYISLAREIEREDRNRLNDPSRYYEVVTHKWPGRTKEWEGTQPGSRSNWTLVMSGDGPLEDNGLYRGVTFYTARFKGKTEGLVAYAVVLTPVMRADGTRKPPAIEDKELYNQLNILGVAGVNPGSYRYPCRDHFRVKYGETNLYAVRASARITLRESGSMVAKSLPTRCMSDALLYYPRSFSYEFSTPLIAFKGDIVAVMIPRDNYLAYRNTSQIAVGTSLPGDSYYAIAEGTVNILAKKAFPEEDGIVISLKAPFKKDRRAAFSFYGDYLLPDYK